MARQPRDTPERLLYESRENTAQVRIMRRQLGLKPLKLQTKLCLRCDKRFKSWHDENRLCYDCGKDKEYIR